jgi:DNA-binding MarR family transcriptional regulator
MAQAMTTSAKERPQAQPGIDAIDRSHLSSLLGFRLRRAETAMHRDFIQSLKPVDLTQKHLAVLLLIRENPAVSQIQLCALLGADPNTMMAFLDRLSDRGLVLRVRSRSDRRKMELHISTEGARLLREALMLVDEHEHRFRSRFSDAELDLLMDFLDRLSVESEPEPA